MVLELRLKLIDLGCNVIINKEVIWKKIHNTNMNPKQSETMKKNVKKKVLNHSHQSSNEDFKNFYEEGPTMQWNQQEM